MSAPFGGLQVLQNILGILTHQMGLAPEQAWIYDQKRDIPVNSTLWVTLRFLTAKPFGNKSTFDESTQTEYQSVNVNAVMLVDIFSKDTSALDVKEQVLLAFSSIYARQMMERYAFNIGRLPVQFTDLSQIEGEAIPYRFQIGFQVQYKLELSRSAPYYDSFTDQFQTEA